MVVIYEMEDELDKKLENLNISDKKYIIPSKRNEIKEDLKKDDKSKDIKEKSVYIIHDKPIENKKILTREEIAKLNKEQEKKDTDKKTERTERTERRPKINVSAINRMIAFNLGNQLTKEQRAELREQAKQKEKKV